VSRKIKLVCAECGGDNVYVNLTGRWDTEKQSYVEVDAALWPTGNCYGCGEDEDTPNMNVTIATEEIHPDG